MVVKETRDVTLSCDATGGGVMTYVWDLPSGLQQSGSDLALPSIHGEAAGVYTCTASNGAGAATRQVNLTVTPYQPVEMVSRGSPWMDQDQPSSPASFTCHSEGKPQPNVTWVNVYDNSTQDFIQIGEVLLWLTFDPARDNGVYSCQANNVYTGDAAFVAVYKSISGLDCSKPFTDAMVQDDVVYRGNCPPACRMTSPAPQMTSAPPPMTSSGMPVTSSSPGTTIQVVSSTTSVALSPICEALIADGNGDVAWMKRSNGDVIELTQDASGQLTLRNL